jgi:hypothetical protein
MDRIIRFPILAALLAFVPLSMALAGPPDLPGRQPSAAVVKAAVNSAPKAVFPQTKFEFAPVFEGKDITHDFIVENKGAAPLVINKIKPD